MDASLFYQFRDLCMIIAAVMLVKYFIFLMVAPWYSVKQAIQKRRLKNHPEDLLTHYRPVVSVIVPAWNEEVGILRTVKSLMGNTYKNTEIIVVNDGSTDNSHKVIMDFLQTAEYKKYHEKGSTVVYLERENGGKGVALNTGISNSTGEIIVTMDADTVISKTAIANIVKHFSNNNVQALVGNVKVAQNDTLIGKLQELEYLFGFYYKRAHCVMGAEYIYGGACAAFRRAEVFGELGLFDATNKTEDIELSMRTKYFGLKSIYAEDVICYTEGAASFMGLLNQRLRWKKGRFDTFLRYRAMFFSVDKRHNKWLSWFILPYSMLSEGQLLLEPLAISLLVTYSVISGDYVSLALGVLFVWATYLVNSLFSHHFKPSLAISFIYTWPLFYILVTIEFLALLKSLFMVLRGKEIVWQSWERKGVEV